MPPKLSGILDQKITVGKEMTNINSYSFFKNTFSSNQVTAHAVA